MNEYIQAEKTAPVAAKRQINSDLETCGKMLTVFMVLNIVLRVITGFFLPEGIVAAVCPTVSFGVTFLVLFNRDYNKFLKGRFSREKNTRGKIMSGTADCMFAILAVTVCLGVITAVIDITGIDIFSSAIDVSVPLKGFGGVVYAVYMCLIAPVMHELIFRGVVADALHEENDSTVVFISALFYALLHGVYITSIYAFVTGIIMGRISLKVKSLGTMIKLNIVCSLILYITMFAVSKNWFLLYIPMFIIFAFFALMGFIKTVLAFLAKRKKQEEKINFGVLCTVPLLVAAVLMIVEDILFLIL